MTDLNELGGKISKLDEMERKLRVLDLIARNPTYGFHDVVDHAKGAKGTLAKIIDNLAEEGYIVKERPEKLGRAHKTKYKLTHKGLKYLSEKKIVLSLIEDLIALASIPFKGATPVSVTFIMREKELPSILIRMQDKMAEKLFEALGGKQTVNYYKHTGEVPSEYLGMFSRLVQGVNAVLLGVLDKGLGPMIVSGCGEVIALPQHFDEPLNRLLQSPQGIEFLGFALKLYEKIEKKGAHSVTSLLEKLDSKTINELSEFFQ